MSIYPSNYTPVLSEQSCVLVGGGCAENLLRSENLFCTFSMGCKFGEYGWPIDYLAISRVFLRPFPYQNPTSKKENNSGFTYYLTGIHKVIMDRYTKSLAMDNLEESSQSSIPSENKCTGTDL